MTFFLRILFLALLFGGAALSPVLAEPLATAAGAIKPENAAPSVLVPAAEQIGAQLQSLVAGVPDSTDPNEEGDTEPQETFGTRALNVTLNIFSILHTQATVFVTNFAAWPQLSAWFAQQVNDPKLWARWVGIGNDLASTVGFSLLAFIALESLLYPMRRKIRRQVPSRVSGKLATILALFLVRAFPILVFLTASLLMLDALETQKLPRFFVMNVVYAVASTRILMALSRGILSPLVEGLRFIPTTTAQAAFAYRWVAGFIHVIVFGYFCMDIARAFHVPPIVIDAFGNILGLILVVMTVFLIVLKRRFVATILAGHSEAEAVTVFHALRVWLAHRWHYLAIAYLVIGLIETASGVEKGFTLMVRGTIATVGICVGLRFLLQMFVADSAAKARLPLQSFFVRLALWGAAVLGLLAAWGVDLPALFGTPLGQRVMGAVFSISVTMILVVAAYSFLNGAIERHLNRTDRDGNRMEVSARARTLLPLLRNTMLVVFSGVVGLVVLSEVGVNVGPLLAGAGIVGVAIGFGSQTLVKDFITGLFIILENSIAVGDQVTIDTHSGKVENMSLRTLRLRDLEGRLHILPFSEVSKIINLTKGYSYAVMDVGVAYHSNLDRVMEVMRSEGAVLQQDPLIGPLILLPLEMMGVETLGESAVTLRARFQTAPNCHNEVRRAFLLRLKQRFDREGIEIPFPTVVNLLKHSNTPAPTHETKQG